ncbi:MAG: hypothetical protein KF873_08995 [Gemmataceae bacterium]|nr:hypothetical protein [Planctomycetia bacterium]MBX3398864.1 hypothetical protein [Gemmataceae bacterium]
MPPPYGIDVVLADEPVAFVVRYVVPISQLLNTLSDAEILRLAIAATAGAEASDIRHVGYDSCSYTEFSIDGEHAFECTLESTPANVTALEATGFPWSPAARTLAGRVGASAQPIEEVRDAVAAAHSIRLAEMSAWLERKMAITEVGPPPTVPSSLPAVGPPSPPPGKPWWRFWGRVSDAEPG